MQLSNLKTLRSHCIGRPSSTLTDAQWQTEFAMRRLYITPHSPNVKRMKGGYSQEPGHCNSDKEYDGVTNWQSYCTYINDVLRNIQSGCVDYCYFAYQIMDLLKFHYNSLRTKYVDGYWEVWLERHPT